LLTAGTKELVQLLRSYERIAKLLKGTEGTEGTEELQTHVANLLRTWDVDRIQASEEIVSDRIAIGGTHPWRRGRRPALDAMEDRWVTLYSEMMMLKAGWNEVLGESDAITWTLKEEAPFTFTTTVSRGRLLETNGSMKADTRGSSSTATITSERIAAANAAAIALRSEWRTAVAELWAREWTAWMEANTATGVLSHAFLGVDDQHRGLGPGGAGPKAPGPCAHATDGLWGNLNSSCASDRSLPASPRWGLSRSRLRARPRHEADSGLTTIGP
jgi:hypothetical protein